LEESPQKVTFTFWRHWQLSQLPLLAAVSISEVVVTGLLNVLKNSLQY